MTPPHWAARLLSTLRRLTKDQGGNALVIVGAALLPLTAMIGSGIDMSRAYMAQARLQQACDAAAVAGRRVMTGDAVDQNVRNEVNKFLNFNFPQQSFGTQPFTPGVTRPTAGTVRVSAATTLPTVVMKMFGFNTLPINANCDAAQTFVNVDVMLVLDTTGSMNFDLDGKTRIQALREAVMALYDVLAPTQAQLEANGYRLRIGVVPYAQTVNVGRLVRAVNASYIRDPGEYTTGGAYCAGDDCNNFNYYNFGKRTVAHDPAWFANWTGCIEERQTVASAATQPTTAEFARMLDLNIDLIPDGRVETKWQPQDRDAQTSIANNCPTEARRLRAWTRADLQSYINGLSVQGGTYHDIGMIWGNRMISAGGVFADSPVSYNGMRTNKYIVFLSDGQMEPANYAYSAYGTEMVDGRISGPPPSNPMRRFDAKYNDLPARHTARFLEMCRVARAQASVYVIALDLALPDSLRQCATGQDRQAKSAQNSAELIASFQEIGREITELRVAQ